MKTLSHQFEKLVQIVAQLRGPQGCPWDKAQTAKSLTTYIIEEAYELVEAIEAGTPEDVLEELGDFLFQVILQAQVAQDEGLFGLKDVVDKLNQKLVHRHPHVFGVEGPKTIEDVWKRWHQLKTEEKQKPKPVFNYPKNLPSLQAAHKVGIKTKNLGFDWDNADQVLFKVDEELSELKLALKGQNQSEIVHELGDLLFSVSQLARQLGLDAEQSLRIANSRFESRFLKMLEINQSSSEEKKTLENILADFQKLSPKEKEVLWEKAKLSEKNK